MTVAASLLFLALQAAQPTHVEVHPRDLELTVDESARLRAEAYDAEGTRLDQVPVRWFSTDPGVVQVDVNGEVSAVRPGTARVMAIARGTVGFVEIVVSQLPPARLQISLPTSSIPAGASAPARADVRTRLGDALSETRVRYESSDPSIASVDRGGRVFAHRPGKVTIRATVGAIRDAATLQVTANAAVHYEIVPGTETVRTGDVRRFRLRATTDAGREIEGFWPAWTVSGPGASIEAEGSDGVFVAESPGRYRVTALIGEGLARSAVIDVTARRHEAELIAVGRGPVDSHHSGDMWVFEGLDGRDYVYIGTLQHDWMKVWDVTDPANPVLTDSVQVDARRINDVKIHPNRRLGVITREGASNRRNGIVLLDLSRPAHPSILSEYTETVTGGVHNVWIRGDHDLVYACHNGTGDLHIIDISDPARPREVGRWGLEKPYKILHDVIVQDGYAYLSYWDDGLVMLDAGAGTHGGTPTNPALVSRHSYPTGHTHVAWRHDRYLFVGDEIFPASWDPDAPIEARGYIHVLDYSDPEHPVEVGRYEVPEAGAHNVWTEGDRLYVGYYQAGLRVVDISGELRGDLYRQGREIAALKTIDERAVVPNWPMTWGAQVFKGHIYSSDWNSGLWITRLQTRDPLP